MNRYAVCAIVIMFFASTLSAAPRNRYYDEDNAIALKEMRDSLDYMRREGNNHEMEIRVFDEKLKNLDLIIEGLRDQLSESSQVHKEQLKGNSATLDTKISSLETTMKGLVADLKQFKTHASETGTALLQYKQKIAELEKAIDQQNQNIDHLQSAMHSLMDALQVKDSPPAKMAPAAAIVVENGAKTYRIKQGDSLEKIARSHQVTVQALKELNGITNDRILVGKVLQIPEK